ncbi:hypothetical protein EMCRGX_G005908 [Ephydatia muelleri]
MYGVSHYASSLFHHWLQLVSSVLVTGFNIGTEIPNFESFLLALLPCLIVIDSVTGADDSVTGADDSVTGADDSVTGADDGVTGADDSVTGADVGVTGADDGVTGADDGVTGADDGVNGADDGVTGADGLAVDVVDVHVVGVLHSFLADLLQKGVAGNDFVKSLYFSSQH